MIRIGKRDYSSPREYIDPFLRRYRRLFVFDAIIAGLHLPLMVWLILKPIKMSLISVDANWTQILVHLSIACLGILANVLLIRQHPYGSTVAYAKTAFAVGLRVAIVSAAAQKLQISIEQIASDVVVPAIALVFLGYHVTYVTCVHQNRKWRDKLREWEAGGDRTNGNRGRSLEVVT